MSVAIDRRLQCAASDVLFLTVMPTEACNFRCTYCFESFAHGRMQAPVVAALQQLIARRAPSLRQLGLSWYGGEPLLAREIVLSVMRQVAALRARQPGLTVASDMTTNGWHLDRELFTELVGLGVTTFMVSFDGPPEHHDRKRVLAGGGGTFARIWGNLASLRQVPGAFDVRLRLHLDRDNASALGDFLSRFTADFGGDPRFRLMLRQLSRLGGRGDHGLHTLEEEAPAAVAAARDAAARRGLPQYDPTAESAICTASRLNSFVLRADGRVGKCTVALDRPENTVGRLRDDGEIEVDGDLLRPWLRGLLSGDPGHLACPARGWLDAQSPARLPA